MDDLFDNYQRQLDEALKAEQDKKKSIAAQIQNHLGPHSSTADQSFVSRLTELGAKGKPPREMTPEIKGITSNDQPPPPPGGGAAMRKVRVKGKSVPAKLYKSQIKKDNGMEVEVDIKKPPPDNPPSGGAIAAEAPPIKAIKANAKRTQSRTSVRRGRKKADEDEIVVPAPKPSPDVPMPQQLKVPQKRSRTPRAKANKLQPPDEKAATPEPKIAPPTTKQETIPRSRSPAIIPKPKARAKSASLPPPVKPIEEAVKPSKAAKKIEVEPPKPEKRKGSKTPEKASASSSSSGASSSSSLTPPSRIPLNQVADVLRDLVKNHDFSSEDASTIMALTKELNSGDPDAKRASAMKHQLREIYTRNYKSLKSRTFKGKAHRLD